MPDTPNLPVSVHVREDDRNEAHARLSVFVGRNPGARGHCGQLVLRTDEWDELRRILTERESDAEDLADGIAQVEYVPLFTFTVQPVVTYPGGAR